MTRTTTRATEPGEGAPDPRAELGRQGEDLAVEHLLARGATILARTWRCRGGELDVIAVEGRALVVVEVKTRSGTGYGQPAEAVTPAKAQRIRNLTRLWLTDHRMPWCDVRFDVVAVLVRPGEPPRVEHYEGAF